MTFSTRIFHHSWSPIAMITQSSFWTLPKSSFLEQRTRPKRWRSFPQFFLLNWITTQSTKTLLKSAKKTSPAEPKCLTSFKWPTTWLSNSSKTIIWAIENNAMPLQLGLKELFMIPHLHLNIEKYSTITMRPLTERNNNLKLLWSILMNPYKIHSKQLLISTKLLFTRSRWTSWRKQLQIRRKPKNHGIR